MVLIKLRLQVIDLEGNVAGLLNIAKCLWDAIHRLEKKGMKAQEKGGGDDINLAATMLKVTSSPSTVPYLIT